MAEFNPQTSVNLGDNYTTRSQGSTPNRALGMILEGAGNAISLFQKQKAAAQDAGLEKFIRGGVDEIANDAIRSYDPTPKTDGLFPKERTFDPANRVTPESMLPSEVAAMGDQMARWKNSNAQRGMPDSLFNMRVQELAQRAYAKYPQFADKIHTMISQKIGVSPAVDIWKSLKTELDQQSAQHSDEDKQRIAFLNGSEKYFSNGVFLARYKEMTGQDFDPGGNFDVKRAYAAASALASREADMDRQVKELDLYEKGTELGRKNAIKVANDAGNKLVYDIFYVGSKDPIVSNMIKSLTDTVTAGKELTPEQAKQVVSNLSIARQKGEESLDKFLSQDQFSDLTAEDRAKIKAPFFNKLDSIGKAITDKDTGLLAAAAIEAKLTQDNITRDNLTKVPVDDRYKTLVNYLGVEEAQMVMRYALNGEKYLGTLTGGEMVHARVLAAYSYLAGNTSFTDFLKLAGSGGDIPSKDLAAVSNTTVSAALDTLVRGKAPAETRARMVDNLYGPTEYNVVRDYAKTDPHGFFRDRVRPDVVNALKGTPELKKVTNWAFVQAFNFAKPAADTVVDAQQNTDTVSVKYNPDTQMFEMNRKGMPKKTTIPGVSEDIFNFQVGPPGSVFGGVFEPERGQASAAQKAVDDLNQYAEELKPVLDANGLSKEAFFTQLFRSESYKNMQKAGSLGTQLSKTFFDWMDLQGSKGKTTVDLKYNPDLGTGAPPLATAGGQENRATSLLKEFEGFSAKPYDDVNALRAGYGSDTVTKPDGSVERVDEDTVVTKADAERDLNRRVSKFQEHVIGKIGEDVWSGLNEDQQAALTSITYNYGRLPKTVAQAVKSGDLVKAKQAILALGAHNKGVNKKRRVREAELFLPQ